LVDKQARQLKEQNPDGVGRSERIVRFDELEDESGDDVLRVFRVRSRRTSDQLFSVTVLKTQREAGNDDELKMKWRKKIMPLLF
jgi:hypothetical protein